MKRALVTSAAILAVIQIGTSAALASPITFDFANGGMRTGLGNEIVLTVDGLTATLRGFSVNKTGGDFTISEVTRWSTGAGNCNGSSTEPEKSGNCSSPNHAVDNGGNDNRVDVLYVEFTSAITEALADVILHQALISSWNSDFDVSYWAGTGSISLAGLSLAELTSMSMGGRFDDDFTGTTSNGNTRPVPFSGIELPVNWIVFGAQVPEAGTSTSDKKNDAFKFKLLTVEEHQVPAPGVIYLLGAGMLALGLSRRRR
jgi:hypothetical protein